VKSQNIRYLPGVDHLRAVAALLIVYYHGLQLFTYYERFHQPYTFGHWLQSPLWYLGILLEGHTAVALFMVLSGFIFTYGSLGKEVIYSRFLANRFLRTYPLFILLVFVGISAFPGQFELLPLLQTMFGFANASGALQLKSFSSMFWAISVEWHFYLVFPFLLLFLQRYGVKYLLGLMAVFLVFRVMAFYQGAQIRDLTYMTIIGRMDQFLLGMLVAVVYARGRIAPIAAGALLVAALAGVMLLLAGAGCLPDLFPYHRRRSVGAGDLRVFEFFRDSGWDVFARALLYRHDLLFDVPDPLHGDIGAGRARHSFVIDR
jgi:peptidoglycan/LPS O-acetylase OafA/YrhL